MTIASTRRDLHLAVDGLSVAELAAVRQLAARSTDPNARVWFSEVVRSIARAAEQGSPLSPGLAVMARCPDCLGPTHCDCPQGDGCGC